MLSVGKVTWMSVGANGEEIHRRVRLQQHQSVHLQFPSLTFAPPAGQPQQRRPHAPRPAAAAAPGPHTGHDLV
eukprot:CAMPEP_0195595686 /NCGR_PEP_ID=MMETSP0815-20121206/2070_1 /TAXON_ID=97485 /ORGANISM="Prymnesium parvum, Strain Texoma1" /LENGTH=72 /DNA_ID=CAMNT_0040734949 /DNA_START=344 /DNA_END=562 /DNA_ORIENTATION=+